MDSSEGEDLEEDSELGEDLEEDRHLEQEADPWEDFEEHQWEVGEDREEEEMVQWEDVSKNDLVLKIELPNYWHKFFWIIYI